MIRKNTLTALYNYFVKKDDTVDLSLAIEAIRFEYEQFLAKDNDYNIAREIVLDVLSETVPLTIKEIFYASDKWPPNFTAGKVQYGLRVHWADDIIKHDNGKKHPKTYTKKA